MIFLVRVFLLLTNSFTSSLKNAMSTASVRLWIKRVFGGWGGALYEDGVEIGSRLENLAGVVH